MIILMSPAKTFSNTNILGNSIPYFNDQASYLIDKLKKLKVNDIKGHMKISENLAKDTYFMYQNFGKEKFNAIHLYNGQAFKGLNVNSFNDEDLNYLNDHLYILSGLYGLIKPFDQISKYRLEIKDLSIMNLYQYWSKKLDLYFKKFHQNDLIINLASNEYSKVLKFKNIITIDFIQELNNIKKSISMYTKLARGMMVNQLIKLRINNLDDIKKISFDGYDYNEDLSSESKLIFVKKIST
jgi:uncharacterized protein